MIFIDGRMRAMQNIFRIGIVAIIFVVGTSATSCQTTGPRQVINDFSESLKKRDVHALIPFVTNEPDYVDRRSFEEHCRIYNLDCRVKESAEGSKNGVVKLGRPSFVGEELVKHVVPTDLFFNQNRAIVEIVSIRENGSEAFAKVRFGRPDSDDGVEYVPLDYDILLYKEKDGWKVFMLNFRHEGDEKYYTYNFYANPHYQAP